MISISKLPFVATAALMLFAIPVTHTYAATDADCEALFKKADTDGDGSVTSHEDMKWEEAISKAGHIKVSDATVVKKQEFIDSCKMGDLDQMMK